MHTPEGFELVEWRAGKHPGVAVLVGIFVLVLALMAATIGGGVFFPLTLLLMMGLLWDYWTPTRIQITPEGILIQRPGRTRRLPWDQVRWLQETPDGLWIAPHPPRGVRGSRKMLFLNIPEDDRRTEVLRFVQRYANLS